jgi:xylulokinase
VDELFLGIDCGTSSVKAVAVNARQEIVATASAALEVSRPRPQWSEQDPEAWWQAAVSAVGCLSLDARRAVRAVGLSGQMHGAVLLGSHDEVLRPAILWNDSRSAGECAELEQRQPRTQSITGNIAMPGFTAPKLLWVARHEPDIFARTAAVLLPKDYLRFRLTGAKVSDMSDAAGTLWLDVGQRAWSDEMLMATGLHRRQMPELVEGNAPSARLSLEAANQLGIEAVIVAGGGGDNAASAVGMGVINPGQAFLSLGTSGVLFTATDQFLPNPARAAHAFCHALPKRWHQMSVMLSAASALDWVSQLAGFGHVAKAAQAAQQRGLHAGTPLFLPYLSGERTPHNDADARGVFFGLSPDTTGADLVCAVLEGVALAFADGAEVLLQAGGKLDSISLVGGGTRVAFWNELLAAALGRPLLRRQGSEVGAAFGAARLARMAYGGEAPSAVCAAPLIEQQIEADPALMELMARRRPVFAKLYRLLQSTFKEFAT